MLKCEIPLFFCIEPCWRSCQWWDKLTDLDQFDARWFGQHAHTHIYMYKHRPRSMRFNDSGSIFAIVFCAPRIVHNSPQVKIVACYIDCGFVDMTTAGGWLQHTDYNSSANMWINFLFHLSAYFNRFGLPFVLSIFHVNSVLHASFYLGCVKIKKKSHFMIISYGDFVCVCAFVALLFLCFSWICRDSFDENCFDYYFAIN